MGPQTAIEQGKAARPRTRWWLVALGFFLLFALGILLFSRPGGPSSFTLQGIGWGPGGLVKSGGSFAGPIDIEVADDLADEGIQAKHHKTAVQASSGLFYRRETRTFGITLTAGKQPIEPDTLSWTAFDEDGHTLATGRLELSALAPREKSDVDISFPIVGDQSPPTRLRIHR